MNHWKSTLAVIGIGQLISILTSTIVGFSIIFWISNEFKSPTALSLAILAGFLPQFVLGLFAGVYVDRWNRKKTMFYSDLFIAFCTLCLFIVITKGYKDLSFFLSIDCLSFNRQYVSCTCFTGKHPSTGSQAPSCQGIRFVPFHSILQWGDSSRCRGKPRCLASHTVYSAHRCDRSCCCLSDLTLCPDSFSSNLYLQPIITQYFIDNKSEIWLLFLIAHSKRWRFNAFIDY